MLTSQTVTLKLHEAVAPPESVAVQVTVVVPSGKAEPEGGLHTTVTPGQLSVTIGSGKLTMAVVLPGVGAITSRSGGQMITGGGLLATVVVEAELFAGLGSAVVAATIAVLLITEPSERAQFAVVSKVTVAPAPTLRLAKVTVRFCPAPPQTPPPVAEQLLKSAPAGNGSFKLTPVATLGPLLRNVMV